MLEKLTQHYSGLKVNNKPLTMKTAILIILVTLSMAVFSQNPARRDPVVDVIVKN
jgi:hypothetical protein